MDFTEPTSEIDKLSSVLEQMLEEYCLSSEATQDHKIFTINYREKNLLVSIKRYPTSGGVRTVVGSVMEIQEEQPKEAVHKQGKWKAFGLKNFHSSIMNKRKTYQRSDRFFFLRVSSSWTGE